ncbi:hypothetical protein GCM10020367_21590 [Streptomyces sannanensis]|uniref:WD40 repeat domain-containing protein n=1 Tax=Streptomyces sannanensis TaxID=285536 RepID=A0ABP6S9L8_9ACTN
MSITARPVIARPVGTAALPGAGDLVSGFALESRAGTHRALLLREDTLRVHDLERVFAGESEPLAAFPFPWPGWKRGEHSVAPDGSFAAFSGQRSVRAVGAGGETLWEYRHGCWDPGHPHTGDELQVCPGIESGSCRVSNDGRLVWAHVPGDEDEDYQERWVVLDARDGKELARLPLDSVASGSNHLSHPDGVHMGLGIGMGQDGILLHWGRWDGETLTTWDVNEDIDRILADVHPGHGGFLTLEHYGSDITLHALDGEVLARFESDTLPPVSGDEDDDPPYFDYVCGFVDAATVIATTTECDEDPDHARHWLLGAPALRVPGRIEYPEPVDSFARPLGDGSWLTHDDERGLLRRWTAASGPEQ